MAPPNWHSSANRAYPEAGFQDTYVNKEATMRYTNYLVPNEYSIVILNYETVLRTTTNFLPFYTLPPTLEFLPFFSHLSILTGHFDLPILGIGRWRLGTSTLFWMEATFRARYMSSTGPTESKSIAFSEKVVICVKSSWKRRMVKWYKGYDATTYESQCPPIHRSAPTPRLVDAFLWASQGVFISIAVIILPNGYGSSIWLLIRSGPTDLMGSCCHHPFVALESSSYVFVGVQ